MVNNEGYLRSIPHVVLFAFVNHAIYKTNLCFLFILVTFVNYNFIITNLFTPLKMEENEALIVAERMKSFIEYKGISVTQFADATTDTDIFNVSNFGWTKSEDQYQYHWEDTFCLSRLIYLLAVIWNRPYDFDGDNTSGRKHYLTLQRIFNIFISRGE